MRTKWIITVLVICFLGGFLPAGNSHAQDAPAFIRLGDLDGGAKASWAKGVSRDGLFVVGNGSTRKAVHGFISMTDISKTGDAVVLLDVGAQLSSGAYGVSNKTDPVDPTNSVQFVAGMVGNKTGLRAALYDGSFLDIYNDPDAYSWTLTTLGDLGGGITDAQGNAVSADGTVVVGYGTNSTGKQAFWWTADLGFIRVAGGDIRTSVATAVTPDGYTVVGYGATPIGNRAFRAVVAADGTVTLEKLGTLSGGAFSEAHAVSPDGAFVVGVSDSPMGPQACYWYNDGTAWVAVGLGGLTGGTFNSKATGVAVNDDGSLRAIVGNSTATGSDETASFLWTPGAGMVNLKGLLFGYDLEVGAWSLFEATGISDDGMVICGTGINAEHNTEAWVAKNVMEIACNDSLDNDGDGFTDSDDSDCISQP